jgi:hypothetical protein
MQRILKTAFFQLICIIIFTFLYKHFDKDFDYGEKHVNDSWIDYLLLSTTIQCSIGISGLNPVTNLGKILLIFHQFIVLYLHIITIYILNF